MNATVPCHVAIGAGMVFGQVDEILDAFLQAMIRPTALFLSRLYSFLGMKMASFFKK